MKKSQADSGSSSSEPLMHKHTRRVVKAGDERTQNSPRVDTVDGQAPEVDPDYWQLDLDAQDRGGDFLPQDTFSRDALVETQIRDGSDLSRAATPEYFETAATPSGSSSVKSRMKQRSISGQQIDPAPPTLPLPRNKRLSGGLLAVEGELAEDESDAPRSPILRPVPVLSPSVFRPHLPVQEISPPTSPVEQFSSPEKGSKDAVRHIFRKVERNIKAADTAAPGSTRDDDSLRLRGEQLAKEAAARNSRSRTPSEDNSYLFRESATPEPVERSSPCRADEEEAVVESTLSQYNDAQEAGRTEVPITQQLNRPDDAAATSPDGYPDFNVDPIHAAPVANAVNPDQLTEELSTGPNMTGVKPKLGFLQEVMKNHPMVSYLTSSNNILLLLTHRLVASCEDQFATE